MNKLTIRRALIEDIPVINKLLYQVHKIHSDARPDLFKAGSKNMTIMSWPKLYRMIKRLFL